MAVFSGTGGGILCSGAEPLPCCPFSLSKTSFSSSERVTGWRSTVHNSSGFSTGSAFPRDFRKAVGSEWRRREGLGLMAGLGLDEVSGLGELGVWTSGRGICKDNLLVRSWDTPKLDFGCNFQPSGSWPVMMDVGTEGGEKEKEVAEEDDGLKVSTEGHEYRLNEECGIGWGRRREISRCGGCGFFMGFSTIMSGKVSC